jgi:recombination protein RecT
MENVSLAKYINQDAIKDRFKEVLGERANTFISAIISLANNNKTLKAATPESLTMAGIMAATLDLPVNQNLGFAYIIPYNCKVGDTWITQGQFQIGYKGIIQLAQRSGQFKTINVSDVKEGEVKEFNRLTGEITFDWKTDRTQLKTVGFVAYFALLNGFSKSLYMTVEQLQRHGLKYSKTYSNEKTKKSSLWETDFDTMAQKTVLKLILSKYAPLSIDMQRAIIADQSIIKDVDTLDVDYTDNTTYSIEETNDLKEKERVIEHIDSATTPENLKEVESLIAKHQLQDQFDFKLAQLQTTKKK